MTGKDRLVSTDYVPSREDRFSFGIWTVGWQGVDVFDDEFHRPFLFERLGRKAVEFAI